LSRFRTVPLCSACDQTPADAFEKRGDFAAARSGSRDAEKVPDSRKQGEIAVGEGSTKPRRQKGTTRIMIGPSGGRSHIDRGRAAAPRLLILTRPSWARGNEQKQPARLPGFWKLSVEGASSYIVEACLRGPQCFRNNRYKSGALRGRADRSCLPSQAG